MRVDYWSLPPEPHAAVTAHFGTGIAAAATRSGGQSGGTAARLTLADGRTVFLKGCPTDHPILTQYEVEGWFGRKVRPLLDDGTAAPFPAPRLLAELRTGGWYVLLFENVDGHDADIGDPADLAACLALCDRLAATAYPDAIAHRIPPVSVSLGHLASGWRRVAADPPPGLDPWARDHLPELCALERGWAEAAAGDTMAHTDLHTGNVLVTSGDPTGQAVDWTRPSTGAAWVDPLLFCLRDPAISRAAALPAWFRDRHDVPAPVLRAFLAGASGHWTDAARLPSPAYAPHLRAYEHHRATASLSWLRRELDR
ncbi:aminoglycoside phosphotransferase family protein [Yinghuangia sp. ASG 101]|uniref:phosphotransferase n=1 Tax=Yinghuangia sp. ASG 101 TaxID=2896848 RepID=UPI001E43EBCA|nr:phosphotransferase [Yinghuangia sp. ASG 101]UGQ09828.1 aminoglycoside phosphotransferase family protein [Yinghuangia sp. ASG 101]